MATLEGTHSRGGAGAAIGYRVEYEVVAGGTIHFRATFDHGGTPFDGQFDFDPARLDPAAAVDAYLQNHIEKSDWAAAP